MFQLNLLLSTGARFGVLVVGFFLISFSALSQMEREVIYGDDDRDEVHRSTDERLKESARAVAVLVERNDLRTVRGNGHAAGYGAEPSSVLYRLRTKPAYHEWNLCADEPFALQPVVGSCSGFLVADDILVSAGHCFHENYACRETAVVFDYSYTAQGGDPTLVKGANLYHCKEVLKRVYDIGSGIDFVLIRLDRMVTDRVPLPLRTEGEVKRHTPLTVISHPLGLPLKVSAQATVRANDHAHYFVANADTYTGSSGAPVIDTRTGLVEGIVVRGEDDFQTTDEDCVVSRVCANDSCRGEDVLRAAVFAKWLGSVDITR